MAFRLFSHGYDDHNSKNAKERKKSIPLAHEKSPAGKQGRLLKAINVRNKKAFSSVTYKGHALTAEEHAAVDQQIEKKRRYWRKQKCSQASLP